MLKNAKEYYDYILIDTPPVHTHFMINGMAAADSVIVVLDPGIFALEGIEILKESFGEFFNKLGLDLNLDMTLITKTPPFSLFRKNPAKEIEEDAKKLLGKRVFKIPYSYHIYGTHLKGIPISHYKPISRVARAYEKVAKHIMEKDRIKNNLNEELRNIIK